MEGSASECIFDEHQEFPDDTFNAADVSGDCMVFLLRYHYFNHRVCGDWIRCGWLSVGVHYAQMLQAIPAGRRPACT